MGNNFDRLAAGQRIHAGSRGCGNGIDHARDPVMERNPSTTNAVAALVGESLREVAVLIASFAPLDTLVQGKSLTLNAAMVTMVVVAPIFGVGLFLQVKHQWKD